MNNFILILMLAFLISCSATNSSKILEANVQNLTPNKVLDEKSLNNNVQAETQISETEELKTFDCSDPRDYKIEEDRDEFNNLVNFIQDDKIVKTLKLPTGETYNGFGFNWAKKTKLGFQISIEYGSRFHYGKEFDFVCRNHQLYLTKINVNTFDKNNPETSGRYYSTNIKPGIPLTKFEITDYITEFGK